MTSSDTKEIVLKLIEKRSEQLLALKAAHGAIDVNAMTEAIESIDKVIIEWSKPNYVPYQLCPKCFGDGHLGRHNTPATVANAMPVCDVCNGAKVIPQFIVAPQTK
jgi:hypothetical protein